MSKNIKNPSIDISVNFNYEQEKECRECYKEISSIFHQFVSGIPELLNNCDMDSIDNYSEGFYFTVYISVAEVELIEKIIEKITEYKPRNSD